MTKTKLLLSVPVLLLAVLACNFIAPTKEVAPPPVTVIVEPTSSGQQSDVPRSEDEVERVPLEVALTALQSGAAVIVDVRSRQAYDESHIAGAISIPLAEIENNPTGLDLDAALPEPLRNNLRRSQVRRERQAFASNAK